jgi:regulator of sigma E protease
MIAALQGLLGWVPLGLPAFLFVILVVVFFHELGHFAVARACGVTVEAFSIGFGPKIFGWKDRHGTMWKVSWLPLGGYVKFLGDMGAASTPDRQKLQGLSFQEQQGAFPFKPLPQRAAVVLAGPVANFILAILIFTAFFMIAGQPVIQPLVGGVSPHSPAQAAGIQKGDLVRSINGKQIGGFSDIAQVVSLNTGQQLTVVLDRQGKPVTVRLTPKLLSIQTVLGRSNAVAIGIFADQSAKITIRHFGLFAALERGVAQTWLIIKGTFVYLWQMITGYADTSQLTGPVGMAGLARHVASGGILDLLNLAALISVSIGLINLFPIPLLDGGHLLYYAFEGVMGRPLGARVQDMGFRLGLAMVLGLAILVTWNDLARLNLF